MSDAFLTELDLWCRHWLSAGVELVLFETGHLSRVTGVRLNDGREVVVKARLPAPRLAACWQVQRRLWEGGFPCPEPLLGPTPFLDSSATCERLVRGGDPLPRAPAAPRMFAELLARLVDSAPTVHSVATLHPAPPWVQWDHDESGPWPCTDDGDENLNGLPGPPWLDRLAESVRDRLSADRLPEIVGHCDWESQNIRWSDGAALVVHDWDSVAARSEAFVVGAAAAVFPADGQLASAATIDETSEFLDAYQQRRGRRWTPEESGVSWAAGLWVRAYNAKKAAVRGESIEVEAFRAQTEQRMLRAHA